MNKTLKTIATIIFVTFFAVPVCFAVTCDYNWNNQSCPESYNGANDGCDCDCSNYVDSDCDDGSSSNGGSTAECAYNHNGATCPDGWNGDGECDCDCNNYTDSDCSGGSTPPPAQGSNYFLHIGGMCSNGFVGNNAPRMANISGFTSVDVLTSQNAGNGTQTASSDLVGYLNQYCTGNNTCKIMNYSNGDNVIGYTFANSSTNWNIEYVTSTAGAGGGSEISIDSWIAEGIGGCELARHLGVSETRNLYNHYDTPVTTYHIAGLSGGLQSFMLPGEDDGAVAFHSAGAFTDSWGETSLCSRPHFTNHVITYTCDGYSLGHSEMKMKFITQLESN